MCDQLNTNMWYCCVVIKHRNHFVLIMKVTHEKDIFLLWISLVIISQGN